MTDSTSNPRRIATLAGLAYGYLRIVYEAVTNFTGSTSLLYLVGIVIGLHALLWWRARLATGESQTSQLTLHLIGLVILLIALVADAVRLAL